MSRVLPRSKFNELHAFIHFDCSPLSFVLDFINIIDPNRTDEVSFAEVDAFLFKIANKIDDSNLIPEIEVTGVPYLKDFSKSNDFLSGTMLRKLVYFEDLREYTAMHEVYRLTGHVVIGSSSTFPAPSLWRQGQGVELFWQLYTSETGKFYFCIQCQ